MPKLKKSPKGYKKSLGGRTAEKTGSLDAMTAKDLHFQRLGVKNRFGKTQKVVNARFGKGI